jgi:hypothetical protein
MKQGGGAEVSLRQIAHILIAGVTTAAESLTPLMLEPQVKSLSLDTDDIRSVERVTFDTGTRG